MKALTVEYITVAAPWTDPTTNVYVKVPVVRLAEVDKVIAEAVAMAAAITADDSTFDAHWKYAAMQGKAFERAEAFLASPLVAAWRERQEGKA